MNVDPVDYLVKPRIQAMLISMPIMMMEAVLVLSLIHISLPGGGQFLYGLTRYGGFGSGQQKADIGQGRLQKLPLFNGIRQGFIQRCV